MTLEETCKEHGIPEIEIDYDQYRTKIPELHIVKELAAYPLILIGGKTAEPELLGYRRIRRPSTDLDYVLAGNVTQLPFALSYDRAHGCLFFDYNGIAVSIMVGAVHDWKIPKDFFTHIRNVEGIACAAPEYTIMMKARRAEKHGRWFGKDKLDIANLLLAPFYRDLPAIDGEHLLILLREHTSGNIKGCIAAIEEAERSLTSEERIVLYRMCEDIRNRAC